MTDATAHAGNAVPSPTSEAPEVPPPADDSGHVGFGVDVGGSGIKGGRVDLRTGTLIGDRIKILTPQPSTPDAVADTVRQIVEQADWHGAVGVTLPSVITGGIVRTAANIDKGWIGVDAASLFGSALGARALVVNDADAAGLAESIFGAGKGNPGLVMMLTLGTGIGTALIQDGVLVPNAELGHLEVDGKEAEHRAASSVKEAKDWSYPRWAQEVSKVLVAYESLLWPDLFIAGGGISRKSAKWIPLLTNRTPVVPAQLLNTAGIVGAAHAVTGTSTAQLA